MVSVVVWRSDWLEQEGCLRIIHALVPGSLDDLASML
jgi:hypothetical protein